MKRKLIWKFHFVAGFFEMMKEGKDEKRFTRTIEMKQKVEMGIIFSRNWETIKVEISKN
jgi:hypothetical protein